MCFFKQWSLCLFLALFHFTACFADEQPLDLEAMAQDFVLETKQIYIPGYPEAFNPSIIRWKDSLIMTFRIIPNAKDSFTCYLGIVFLDEEFNVVSTPQILDFRGPHLKTPSRAEDARLVTFDDRLYIVYDDNVDIAISKAGFRVYVAELVLEGSVFQLNNIDCLKKFEGESSERREKAWVPFDYNGNLLLSYMIDPHIIFYPILGTGECQTIARTSPKVPWSWGELRGGTPAIQIDESHYLSIFHSSTFLETIHSGGKKMTHYFMGAYLFNAQPPFELTHISPEPIFGKFFYNGPVYKHYWKPIRAVFPCGIIADGPYLWVSYGRDDHEIWVVKIDKNGLLKSLINVKDEF